MNDPRHDEIDQLCAQFWQTPEVTTTPHSPPIYLSSVYACDSPDDARQMLSGQRPGYVYQRDGHPNGDMLAERCRLLHAAKWSLITSTGMSAMAAVLLGTCEQGDRLVVSQDLYGRTLDLLRGEAARLGVSCELVDTSDLAAVEAALAQPARLVVAETISNPTLKIADIPQLAELCHRHGTKLAIDNTFASPWACRPLTMGADYVVESMTKIMNGHADGLLGLVCGNTDKLHNLRKMVSIWGLSASAFDCWLVARGLSTLHLRAERATANAQAVAQWLSTHPHIEQTLYPGLASHPQHATAARMLAGRFGTIVTFTLRCQEENPATVIDRFIRSAGPIPFCPSLGDLATSLSHPASTSHGNLTPAQLAEGGISPATVRLSVGVETVAYLQQALDEALTKTFAA